MSWEDQMRYVRGEITGPDDLPMTDKKITDGLNEKALEAAWEAAARENMTEDCFGPTEWLMPEVKDRWRRIARAAISAYLKADGLIEAIEAQQREIERLREGQAKKLNMDELWDLINSGAAQESGEEPGEIIAREAQRLKLDP